jgi:hypothetical protein
LFVLSC